MDLFIPGPAGRLQAVEWLPEGEPRAACALCHPHPLRGGTLETTVVFRMARALQEAGLAVVRFNFRGVDRSAGVHDGNGGEEDDLAAVLDWIGERHPGLETWAGGYSFGARTAAALALRQERIARLLLAALPVEAFNCSFLTEVRCPGLIVMAGADEFGTLSDLRRRFPHLAPELELDEVPAVDHFFRGRTKDLQARVRSYAERSLGVPT